MKYWNNGISALIKVQIKCPDECADKGLAQEDQDRRLYLERNYYLREASKGW